MEKLSLQRQMPSTGYRPDSSDWTNGTTNFALGLSTYNLRFVVVKTN